jgi:hypothetical protein
MTNDKGANVAQSGNSFANGTGTPAWVRLDWQFRELQAAQVDRWKVEA